MQLTPSDCDKSTIGNCHSPGAPLLIMLSMNLYFSGFVIFVFFSLFFSGLFRILGFKAKTGTQRPGTTCRGGRRRAPTAGREPVARGAHGEPPGSFLGFFELFFFVSRWP